MEAPAYPRDRIVGPQPAPIDPVERWLPFALRMAALGLSGLMLLEAAMSTWSFPPSRQPFLYSMWYVWIITPIHEAGHLLFLPFGRIMNIAGGSFWQIVMPLLLAGVAFRQRSWWASVYLVLAGVHSVALNPYIYDAPYRSLPLLGHRSGHDWYNLLIHWQALDIAEDLAMAVYVGGIAVGTGGLVLGLVWGYLKTRPPKRSPVGAGSRT